MASIIIIILIVKIANYIPGSVFCVYHKSYLVSRSSFFRLLSHIGYSNVVVVLTLTLR